MKATGQETIDELINIPTKSDLFSSFNKAETNPTQWLHWLDILDQQTSNQGFGSSTLESALDFKGSRQQETLRLTGKSSATKDSLDSSVKSGNMFGRGLQSSGDKYQPLKFPEAMVAIAQAAKDLPGWPLMSNKMQMHKCEKCSQEFCSTLNQRRHMRATHRRPLNGDKEDLKTKREQITAFWDKLDAEVACEILSAKNLLLMDLSGASVVRALTTQLQQPSLLLLPQTYIKVATALLDLVQNKSSKVPVNSAELFATLDDASEKNLLYGVTSSSMHRCIFDSEPARVGLETKNLVAALGFLVEYRLVRAWMDDKDVEALRCQKALVEEEEAAQKKRAKLLERKRQRKLRQKEFKDKERKSIESSSGLHELKFDLFPREGEDSLTATQSSPSSSGYSGLDSHSMETPQMTNGDFEGANKSPTNHLEDGQSFGDPDDLEENRLGSFNYTSSQNLESQGDSLEERVARPSTGGSLVDGGLVWKDRRQGDFSYFPSHGRQPYSKDKRHYDHQYGSQKLTRTPFGNSGYSHYREKLSNFKRPAPVTGVGYAIWARKTPQAPAAVSQRTENDEGNVNEVADDSIRARVLGQSENVEIGDSRRPKGLSRVSSLSSDSATSHSSGSISARVGAEEQENTNLTVPVSSPQQIASAEADFAGSGALVIGSVTIPLGDAASSSLLNVESDRCLKEEDSTEVNFEGKRTLPDKAHFSHVACVTAEDPSHLSCTSSLDAEREASATPRGITSYQSGVREEFSAQSKNLGFNVQSKPVVIKVWRPVTPGDRNNPHVAEVERSDAADISRGEAGVNFSSHSRIQLQRHISGSGGVGDTSTKKQRDHEAVTKGTTTPVFKDGQHPAGFRVTYYSELASFLSQRWQKAISSPDIVCYNKMDDLDGVPSG